MIFFPWYSALMLAVEANHVIDIRLRKLTTLSLTEANTEVKLMFSEKAKAAAETAAILMFGGSPGAVIAHYREAVAANNSRLAPSAG